MKRRRKRIFRGAVLAFAIAAFAVPTAQARQLTKWGTNPTATTAAATLTPQQLDQELRFQGVDKEHGLIGRTTTSVQSSSTSPLVASSSGFDWGDAFIGAAATFATLIVLVAGFTAMRRREQPLGV
jgi:hypothetical protein